MIQRYKLLAGVALLSLSLITYEVALTRLFSAIFVYHYVFLVISFAVMGLGVGGFLLHLTRSREDQWIRRIQSWYGIIYLLTLSVIYFSPFLVSPVIYISIGAIPFVLGGYLLGSVFKRRGLDIGQLYFSDLIGSTLGVVVILLVFQQIGTFASMIFISGVAGLSMALLIAERRSAIAQLLLGAALCGLLFVPGLEEWGMASFRSFYSSPYSPAKDQKSEFMMWDSFARTDVFPTGAEKKMVLLDGSAGSTMYKFDGDVKKLTLLKKEIGYLPFELHPTEKALVLGPGGGADIIFALLAGVKEVTAVEINPGSVKAVEAMAEFSGDIYNHPQVRTYVQDGRNFVEQNDKKYDQIYLSVVMTNLADNAGKVLVENYIYTEEAINEYLQDLTDDGVITFLMHKDTDMMRLVSTLISLSLKAGHTPQEIMQRMIIYFNPNMQHGGHAVFANPVVTFKKVPFSPEEAQQIGLKVYQAGFNFLTLPYLREDNILGSFAKGQISFLELQQRFPMNMRPVTDDNPFIYQATRTVPGYLKLLLGAAALGLGILYLAGRKGFKQVNRYPGKFAYFAILGVGFMLLEIVLIQRFAVYLGYPILTFAVVLGALLLSSGIGSYFAGAVSKWVNPLLAVGGYGLVLNFLVTPVVQATVAGSMSLKIGVIILLLSPLGFFMGMGFPTGIQRLKSHGEEAMVPLIWAANGVASVAGSVLSMILALQTGFLVVGIVGAVLYLANGTFSRWIFAKE